MISPAMAELDETQVVITSINNNIDVGEYVQVTGQLLYANGSEITIGFMEITMIGMYVNDIAPDVEVQCNATGHFGMQKKLNTAGINTVQIVFRGKEHTNLAASNSSIYNINVIEEGASGNLNSKQRQLESSNKTG